MIKEAPIGRASVGWPGMWERIPIRYLEAEGLGLSRLPVAWLPSSLCLGERETEVRSAPCGLQREFRASGSSSPAPSSGPERGLHALLGKLGEFPSRRIGRRAVFFFFF